MLFGRAFELAFGVYFRREDPGMFCFANGLLRRNKACSFRNVTLGMSPIATSRTQLWLASVRGCQGPRLSTESESLCKRRATSRGQHRRQRLAKFLLAGHRHGQHPNAPKPPSSNSRRCPRGREFSGIRLQLPSPFRLPDRGLWGPQPGDETNENHDGSPVREKLYT
jgi:hypothetical protein